jgi:hypothetical protein
MELVSIDAKSPMPECFVEVMQDPRITDRSRSDLARLFAVCSRGGVAISPDLCLLAPLDAIINIGSFCSSTKNFSPLPCIFGNFSPDLITTLDECMKEMVAQGMDVVLKLQNFMGLVQGLFLHPRVMPMMTFVAYQKFAVFGVQSNAAAFVLADEEVRTKMMSQISGRFEGITPLGVFSGKQNHKLPLSVISVVRKNIQGQHAVEVVQAVPQRINEVKEVQATFKEMVSGVLEAVKSTVKQVARGEMPAVSDEALAARLVVCTGDENTPKCESYLKDSGRCATCGCYMRLKARIKAQQCPLGKW